ncbi:MAG: hypothetical protein ACLP9L_14010 [Thermoguttaceae bacterium]
MKYRKPLQGCGDNVWDIGQKCAADKEVYEKKQESDNDSLH